MHTAVPMNSSFSFQKLSLHCWIIFLLYTISAMKKKSKSKWTIYFEMDTYKDSAICRTCGDLISVKHGTSGMKRHSQHKHGLHEPEPGPPLHFQQWKCKFDDWKKNENRIELEAHSAFWPFRVVHSYLCVYFPRFYEIKWPLHSGFSTLIIFAYDCMHQFFSFQTWNHQFIRNFSIKKEAIKVGKSLWYGHFERFRNLQTVWRSNFCQKFKHKWYEAACAK